MKNGLRFSRASDVSLVAMRGLLLPWGSSGVCSVVPLTAFGSDTAHLRSSHGTWLPRLASLGAKIYIW